MDDDFYDDAEEPAYMFNSLSDLINFVTWLMENFDNPEDFEAIIATVTDEQFEEADAEGLFLEDVLERIIYPNGCTRGQRTEDEYLKCPECGAIFATPSGLGIHQAVIHADLEDRPDDNEFWSIIENSYTNHQEETNGDLRHPE